MAPKTGPAILTLKLGGEVGASFKKSISKAQKQLSTFNQNVKRSINDAATGAAQGFKNVIRNDAFQASAVAAAGLGAALTGAVRTAADFQSGMLKVKAISGANEEQFRQLTAKAKELGRTTQFSARQASDAMGFLAMAGYNTNQILSATPQMMNLAAAGSIELGEAADIASNILGGMGLKIEDTAMVTDVLAKAASSGNTNIQMMGEAFKYVAPTAAQAGASIQDMGGAMALLGNSGIQASVAGTGLRSVLLNLSGANTEANKAMAQLGVTNKDAAGNMRPMADILGDIEARMTAANMGSAERLELQKKLFGKTAVSTGALLQEASANGELAAMVEKVTNSQGAAAEMAKIQNSGFEGSMKRLASAAEGLAIAFGGPLLGPLATVAETLAGILTPIGSLLTDMPILGAVAGVAVAAFVGFVAVLPIVAAVKGAFIALGLSASGMWAAITGPVGLAIAAVVGVIAIFQLLYNKVEPFRNFVNALGDIVKTVVGKIVDFFMLLPRAVMKVVGMIRKFFGRGFGAIAKDTIKAVANLALQWFTLPLKVAQVVSRIIAHFTGIDLFQAGADALTSMWEGFKNIWPRFKDWLVNGFKEAVGNIAGRLDPRNWFGGGDDGQQQQPAAIDGERAMGGPVRRGGSYLVGERGPELFSPSQSGQILSNSQTSSALSMAPTINITVTESNATADDIAAAVSRAMDDALMEAEAGVRALLND
jgi:TP901 family phage tail tape measure protein